MLDDARNGKFKVLSIFGVNPALYVPDAIEALGSLDFLAVSELFMTETAQLATLAMLVFVMRARPQPFTRPLAHDRDHESSPRRPQCRRKV